MSWQAMIQMRALKEELVANPVDLSIRCDYYQLAIEQALRGLTPLERRALFLRYWESLPIARVADCLGMSWNSTDELIDRTVDKVKQCIRNFKDERESLQSQFSPLAEIGL